MKRLLLIALAIAAPGYAQESRRTMSSEQYTALQAYFTCIYQQVVEADDGTSDAETLTPKVAPTCRYLLGTAATIFASGNQAERDGWYKKWLALEEGQVAKTLWAVRQDRLVSGEAATSPATSALPLPAPAPLKLASAAIAAARPAPAKARPLATASAGDKPMSEWRRAYIASHGHEPPVAAK